jgi:hypothetical protein
MEDYTIDTLAHISLLRDGPFALKSVKYDYGSMYRALHDGHLAFNRYRGGLKKLLFWVFSWDHSGS